MRLVDTFIYLAEHENDLLYLKLLLESPCVDEWVGVENHFTYRGDFKGAKLAAALQEPRFAPFRDRVKVISIPTNYSVPPGTFPEHVVDPRPFAEAEWRLRDAPLEHLLRNYADDDRVFVSDVDEVIDFTDAERRDFIYRMVGKEYPGQPIQFERIRYWYEFWNRGWRSSGDLITPCYTVGNLKSGAAKLRDKKWVGHLVPHGDRPTIFEYSFCFPYEGLRYKFGTSLHTCWTKENLDVSLECNHWTMTSYQKVDFNNRFQWFEKVELNERNSPAYVRENLNSLRTGLVPETYKENRLRRYNFTANFPENVP